MRLAAVAVLLLSGQAHATELVATRRGGEVVVDGRLDEPAWQAATAFADFWQRAPLEGRPPTHPTETWPAIRATSWPASIRRRWPPPCGRGSASRRS